MKKVIYFIQWLPEVIRLSIIALWYVTHEGNCDLDNRLFTEIKMKQLK